MLLALNRKSKSVVTAPKDIKSIIRTSINRILEENPDLGDPSEYIIGTLCDLGWKNVICGIQPVGITSPYTSLHAVIGYHPDWISIFSADEIDEIIRHELSHVKNGDSGPRMLPHTREARRRYHANEIGAIHYVHICTLAGEAYDRSHRMISRKKKEFAADTTLCKNPDALISMFKKIQKCQGLLPEIFRLFIPNGHPTTMARIHRLQQFKKAQIKSKGLGSA
jgi:hypothetical protein